MSEKVVLVLVDGMRPDGLMQCGNSFVSTLLENSAYALDAQTVMPSVTLPCHSPFFTAWIHSATASSPIPIRRRYGRLPAL